MTTREAVLQRVRTWLKATAISGTPLTDGQCRSADDKGPRPVPPYLTVRVLVADVEVGEDEGRNTISGGGAPQFHTVGNRQGTVSIQGFGRATAGWLERAHLQLRNPVVMRTVLQDEATGEGISLVAAGAGVTEIPQFLDTEIEPRYLREYTVAYAVSGLGDEQALDEATELEITTTFEGTPPDLVTVTTINT